MKASEIELQINPTGDTFSISLPGPKSEGGTLARIALVAAISSSPDTIEDFPTDLESTGDVVEDLEREIANDNVRHTVQTHHTLQDMVAHSFVDQVRADGVATGLEPENLFELAMWFNRCRHLQHKAANGDEESTAYALTLVYMLWADQLLDETV